MHSLCNCLMIGGGAAARPIKYGQVIEGSCGAAWAFWKGCLLLGVHSVTWQVLSCGLILKVLLAWGAGAGCEVSFGSSVCCSCRARECVACELPCGPFCEADFAFSGAALCVWRLMCMRAPVSLCCGCAMRPCRRCLGTVWVTSVWRILQLAAYNSIAPRKVSALSMCSCMVSPSFLACAVRSANHSLLP